jgi:tRNA 2-thiocytidine biosynthesis protein TtcA
MISDGDRILVGLSGGSDSLTLMWMLSERQKRAPVDYQLFAVHIDPGFENGFCTPLKKFCDDNGFSLKIEHTDYGLRGQSALNRENPCFLCSRLRRKRLFEIAGELDCNKLALGHNKDDIIETLFLNILYSGEISSIVPVQPLFQGRFTLIRPLAFADEDLIRTFAWYQKFPEFINPCPTAGNSKRQLVKSMLKKLYCDNHKVKGNIFRAMSRVKLDYLLKDFEQ